ncbi:MAG TPA: BTAD domain-containing putative transcriptional regulator [Acidimicrobiia bacterium]
MEFNVLGPVTVVVGPEALNIGGPKQRTVLAMLIANSGRPVPNDAIVDAVYGDEAPDRGRRRVQTYVSTLRSIVGDIIIKDGRGWTLRVDRSQIDAFRFEDLYESVHPGAGATPEASARLLREALALWRGHPYADIESHGVLEAEVARLNELRVAAQAARIDADLASGRHSDLIGEIEGLIAEHPYLERLRAQHMLALYRAGRQREALRSYEDIRRLLVDELGVDPTPELRELEQRILEQDESLVISPKRQIQTKAVLVADPGDPLELARLPRSEREKLLSDAAAAMNRVIGGESEGRLLPAGAATYAVFDSVSEAATAAERVMLRIDNSCLRIAIDFGDVEACDASVSGAPVSRAAVLVSVAHQGQVLLSAAAQQAVVSESDKAGLGFQSLGKHDLIGFEDPVPVYQLLVGDPPSTFPPLDTDNLPVPLPDGRERSVPGYELREPIGVGSVGTLYRAYQPAVGREVMMEVIGRAEASDVDFIRNFEADAQRLALLDHPNINPLVDYWRDPEGAYLVYRYHRGGLLDSGQNATPGMLEQIGAALAHAHSYGVVHGSVRPDRIVLDEADNPYLMCFPVGGLLPQTSPDFPQYIAPETLSGGVFRATVDIYALGVLAHEIESGEASDDEAMSPESPVLARAIAENPADRFESIVEFLDALSPRDDEPGGRFTETRNPYKGLSAFHESDAGDFFGRGDAVDELVEALSQTRFLAVVGPSGVGKSSVIRAGLVPALRSGAIQGSDSWLITDMLPGSHPHLELERAIERIAVDLPADVRESLAGGDPNALAGLQRVFPDDTQMLIIMDQFEELFTMADPLVASEFLELLRTAVAMNQARIVVTLRADFLDRPLLYSEFGELLRESMIVLRAPNPSELAEAIAKPAERVGVRVDPALVERIVADVHDRPGGLPLLQFALVGLFDSRSSDLITIDSYEEIGGVTGSVARRAEALYETLESDQKSALKQVLLRLVTVIDEAAPTRRRVTLAELADLGADSVIDVFARNRMLTFDSDPDTRLPTVEVAHEALLTHWPRLAGWIETTREDLTLSRRLDETIDDWETHNRDDAYLLTGGRLAQHEAWTSSTVLTLSKRQMGYLENSSAHDETIRARSRRRRWWVTAGFGIAAAVAIVFGLVAVQQADDAEANAAAASQSAAQATESARIAEDQRQIAEDQQQIAEDQRQIAEANALVASATAVMDEDAQLALLLAMQGATALPEDPKTLKVLRQALNVPVTVYAGEVPRTPFSASGDLSPDGQLLVVAGATTVELRDVGTGQTLWGYEHGLAGHDSFAVPAFINDGAEIALGLRWQPVNDDPFGEPPKAAGIHILDTETGDLKRRFNAGPCGAVLNPFDKRVSENIVVITSVGDEWFDQFGCGLNPSTRTVLFQDRLLDVNTGTFIPAGRPFEFAPIAFNSWSAFDRGGRLRLFYTADDDLAIIEEVATGKEIFRLEEAPISNGGEISPDGSVVVIGGSGQLNNRQLHVYDIATGSETTVLDGHAGNTTDMEFIEGGEKLMTTGDDGLIKTWDLGTGRLIQSVTTLGDVNLFLWVSRDESLVGVMGLRSVAVVSNDPADSAEIAVLDICPRGDHFYALSGIEVRGDRALVFGSCDRGRGGVGSVFDLNTYSVVGQGPLANSQGYTLSREGMRVASQKWTSGSGSGIFGTAVVTDLQTGEQVEMDGLCSWQQTLDSPGCERIGVRPYGAFAFEFDFSPDGTLLAMSARSDSEGQVWSVETGQSLAVWPFTTAAFTPDGNKIVTVGGDPSQREVRSTDDFSVLSRQVFSLGQGVIYIIVTPDGSTVVGIEGSSIVFYDTETLDEVDRWNGAHASDVRHIAVSDDGSMLASVGFDGLARVWDLDTGALLHDIQVSDNDRGQAIGFANDDKHLLVSVAGGPLAIYTLDAAELLQIARSRVSRGFTDTECDQYFGNTTCPTLQEMKSGS